MVGGGERGGGMGEPLDQNLAKVEAMYPLPPEIPVDWLRDARVDPSQVPALLPTDAWREIKAKVGDVTADRDSPMMNGQEGEMALPNEEAPSANKRQPLDSSEPAEMPAPGNGSETRASKKRSWSERFF